MPVLELEMLSEVRMLGIAITPCIYHSAKSGHPLIDFEPLLI